jgi:Tfp pilus assembly protein PilX
MVRNASRKNRRSERGIALFVAIFTVLLITAIGAGMIMLTMTDTSISGNFRDEQKAFFASKAGMEEVRDRFRSTANNSLATNLSDGDTRERKCVRVCFESEEWRDGHPLGDQWKPERLSPIRKSALR